MKIKFVIPSLIAICTVAVIIRTVYQYHTVFSGGFINFLEYDAWRHMAYAREYSSQLPVQPISTFLSSVQNCRFFAFIIAVLSQISPLETAGAWLPPALAVLAIIVTYAIGSTLFNREIGVLSALFVAIIPSEFLTRSQLGYADQHTLEALMIAIIVLCLAKSLKEDSSFNRYSIFGGISIFIYIIGWNIMQCGLYLASALLGAFFVASLVYNVMSRQKWHSSLLVAVLPLVLGLAIYLSLGGYENLTWLIPSFNHGTVTIATQNTIGVIASTTLAPVSSRTIVEGMPLLEPTGQFNPLVVICNLHLFAVTFLIGLPFLWKYRKNKGVLLLAVWTVLMLVITLNMRRFLYYFTFNVAIISALAVYEIARWVETQHINICAALLSIPLIVVSLVLASSMGIHQPAIMSQEWHAALTWLEKQPSNDGRATSWYDYAPWVHYVADKKASYNTPPQLILTDDMDTARDLLKQMGSEYLIIDQPLVTNKYDAITIAAGFKPPDKTKTFAYRLFYGSETPPFLELIYQSPTIKVYQLSD